MNRLLLRLLLAALLVPAFIITQVNAQTPAASSKIAWVKMDAAILTCGEGKEQLAKIQEFIDAKNTELGKLRKELEALRNKLENGRNVLKPEALLDLEYEVENKETHLQRFSQDTQKEINSKRDRIANAISIKMQPVLEAIAERKGLSAIMIYNPTRDAWFDESLDITNEIIKEYDQKNAVAAPKTTAKPATP